MNYSKRETCCPVCKHDIAFVQSKYHSNGVLGSGHSSFLTDQYYICEKCGVHFNMIADKQLDVE